MLIDEAGVLTLQHRYAYSRRGWLACECGAAIKDENGRGIHMPEGVPTMDAAHERHLTDVEIGRQS